jgi:hypothetical protein
LEINTKQPGVPLGGLIRDADFALHHIHFKMEARKVLTTVHPQPVHQKPGNPGPQAVFQLYEEPLVCQLLPFLKNPVKMQVNTIKSLIRYENSFHETHAVIFFCSQMGIALFSGETIS